jgi:DNA replication and repair protein RecF
MILKRLKLQSFRNYERCDIEFHPGKNVLFGRNGQGKTNVLESIYYLALTKSFRTSIDQYLILHKENLFRIQAELNCFQERKHKISMGFSTTEGKRLIYNGQKIYKFAEYIGTIPLVLLAPSDLEISQMGPFKRRHFLDIMLSQASKLYLNDLIQYRRSLRQRNAILQSSPLNQEVLKSWDEALILSGTSIIEKRLEATKTLDHFVKEAYNKLSGGKDSTKIVYQSVVSLKHLDNIKDHYREALAMYRSKDQESGITNLGPHRDDLLFLINGMPLRSIGSQGEHKTFTIALKMAEFKYLQNIQPESPILLLDDVFAELDSHRLINMIDTLSEMGQVFITTTSPDFFGKVRQWDPSTFFYEIKKGELQSLGNKWQKQNQLIN